MGSGSDTYDGHVLAHRRVIILFTRSMVLRGHNFVYKEHGSSKGVHDQPCESTGLTERHARMIKNSTNKALKRKNDKPI